MEKEIIGFLDHLEKKGAAKNTLLSYKRDLFSLMRWLETMGIFEAQRISETLLRSYILQLEAEKSPATVARNLSVIHRFFEYLVRSHEIYEDPSESITAPKVEKKPRREAGQQDMELLLAVIDQKVPIGLRDHSILMLMRSTGFAISRILALKVEDINLRFGYAIDPETGKIVSFDNDTRRSLQHYLGMGREALRDNKDTDVLFLNNEGTSLSRQGLWKNMKKYSRMAGLDAGISPRMVNNTPSTGNN